MNCKLFASAIAIAVLTAGCTTTSPTANPDTGMINPYARAEISGSVTYRERMMAPPGSTVIVSLQDISRADAASTTIAEQRIPLDGRSVPVDYRLTPLASDILPDMTYSVRAEIRAANGALLWTSDTANMISTSQMRQSLPMIVMVKAGRDDSAAISPLVGTNWRISSIGGVPTIDRTNAFIRFGSDGQVSGSTGCNRLSGSYAMNGDAISMSSIASTRMACVPALMDQEARYMAVVPNIVRYSFNPDNSLTFFTATGASMRGER